MTTCSFQALGKPTDNTTCVGSLCQGSNCISDESQMQQWWNPATWYFTDATGRAGFCNTGGACTTDIPETSCTGDNATWCTYPASGPNNAFLNALSTGLEGVGVLFFLFLLWKLWTMFHSKSAGDDDVTST